MINLENNIIATVVAVLCISQHIAAEYAVVNKTNKRWSIRIYKSNRAGDNERRTVKPDERWVINDSLHDNAKKVILTEDSTGLIGMVIASSKDITTKDWKTIVLEGGSDKTIRVQGQNVLIKNVPDIVIE